MNAKLKDVLNRAFKTFWQAGVAYIIAALPGLNLFDGSMTQKAWMGFAVAAFSAAASAAWNGVIKPAWDIFMKPDPGGR